MSGAATNFVALVETTSTKELVPGWILLAGLGPKVKPIEAATGRETKTGSVVPFTNPGFAVRSAPSVMNPTSVVNPVKSDAVVNVTTLGELVATLN
jgi:hypothetical protein